MNNIESFVKGNSNIFAVIGNPVSHSFSPIIHNSISRINNDNICYVPFKVLEDNLEQAINGAFSLGIKGINVTVPHKKEVMKYLYKIDPTAEKIGTCNTLKYTENGYIGYNTDCIGIESCLKNNNIEVEGKTIVILGAGGSSYAASVMAATNNAKKIIIGNRTIEKANTICKHVNKYYDINTEAYTLQEIENVLINLSENYIIIQTTTLGFGENINLSPINNNNVLKKAEFVLDIIYTPWKTKLLSGCDELSVKNCNGFDMLIYQAIGSYEIWNDIKFDKLFVENLKNNLKEYYFG